MNPELPGINDDIARLGHPLSDLLVERSFVVFGRRELLPAIGAAACRTAKPQILDERLSEANLLHGFLSPQLPVPRGPRLRM